MKPVRLHSLAQAEIREAIAFYNDARDGLGDEFRDEVEAALAAHRKTTKGPFAVPQRLSKVRFGQEVSPT